MNGYLGQISILIIIMHLSTPAAGQGVIFSNGTTLASTYLPPNILPVDVDEDGQLDLVVNYTGYWKAGISASMYWYKGPSLTPHKIWSAPDYDHETNAFTSMCVADFNQDGKKDFIGEMGGGLRLIDNITVQTSLTLDFKQISQTIQDFIIPGDLNKDGWPDFVIESPLSWFENMKDPTTSFTQHRITSRLDAISALRVVDMDRDGNLDIVAGSYPTGTALYLNNGALPPVFTENRLTTDTLLGDVGDLDRDGDLDILVKLYPGGFDWLENDGARPPKFSRHHLSDVSLTKAKWCDLDGDGDLDIAGNRSSALSYLENQGGVPPTYREYSLKQLQYSVVQLQIVHLLDPQRWQYLVTFYNDNPYNPWGQLVLYDTVVAPRNCVKDDRWNQYR